MPKEDARPSNAMHACQRCRRRKQKCDQRYPRCSNCASAAVECMIPHPGKDVDIARDYVSRLESEISQLNHKVLELQTQLHTGLTPDAGLSIDEGASVSNHTIDIDRGTISPSSGQYQLGRPSQPQDLDSSVRNVVIGPSNQSQFLGQSSGLLFARMVMAAVHVDNGASLFSSDQDRAQDALVPAPPKASLPPHRVAEHLIDVYFQYRTPHLPILTREQVLKAVDNACLSLEDEDRDLAPEKDLFVAYMVFAIALVDVPGVFRNRPSESEGCFLSAMSWIEKVLTSARGDLETLRTVLLLAQYVALCPPRGSLWHLTGFALRLCIDLGLHSETDAVCQAMPADLLNERRRLWYCTYHLDRLLCITLGRPFGILDESIQVQLPNPWTGSRNVLSSSSSDFDIHIQRAHNHLFALDKLESEIKHVQQSQALPSKIAYPRPNWSVWLQDIEPRLQEWSATIPDPARAHPASIFTSQAYWDVSYNNAVLLLYRPQSTGSAPRSEELVIVFEASCKVIAGLKVLQREGRVEMLWKSVHHLFLAGLGVIYALWHCEQIRNQRSVGECIATLQSCASSLAAMSETFKGARGCRNAFDTLSTATIDWLVAMNAESSRRARLDLESNANQWFEQLKLPQNGLADDMFSGLDNISALLSGDGFDLSEQLNAAAQWFDREAFTIDQLDPLAVTGVAF